MQAAIMAYYEFEGWLVNIENAVDPENIDALKDFLVVLRRAAKTRVPDAKVWARYI